MKRIILWLALLAFLLPISLTFLTDADAVHPIVTLYYQNEPVDNNNPLPVKLDFQIEVIADTPFLVDILEGTRIDTALQDTKTAVETIATIVDDGRGLVTEDNSADILIALETLAGIVSGTKGLVTEDNSADILTELEILAGAVLETKVQTNDTNSADILSALQSLVAALSNDKLQVDINDISDSPIIETNSADILSALETLAGIVSESKAAVTETNSGDIKTAVEAIQTATAAVLSDTIQHDSAAVNPYTAVEKTYTNIKKIEIYNPGIDIRLAFGDTVTTDDNDDYWIIPNDLTIYRTDGLNFASLDVKLKGDAETDTGVVRIIVWR